MYFQVYFLDSESPSYTKNKRCEFVLKGNTKGVLESPRHSLSPNTTCTYHLEGTDLARPPPTYRPSPGRYPIQYDPKYWLRQTTPPPSRYRVWLSVLKFHVSPPLIKTDEICSTHLEVWDGYFKEPSCNDVFW